MQHISRLRTLFLSVSLVLCLLPALAGPCAAQATAPEKPKDHVSWPAITAAWVLLFAASMYAGYRLGKARSINFEDPDNGEIEFQKYVAGKVRKTVVWATRRDDHGELLELAGDSTCRFRCGSRVHVYSFNRREHSQESVTEVDVDYSKPPRNGLTIGDAMGAFPVAAGVIAFATPAVAGVAHGIPVPTVVNAAPSYANLITQASGGDKIKLILLGLLALGLGGGLGYLWGYRNQPQITEPLKKLLEDELFWQGVAARVTAQPVGSWVFEKRGDWVFVRPLGETLFLNARLELVPAPSKVGLPSEMPRPHMPVMMMSHVPTDPPDDLIQALQQIRETALVSRLKSQVRRPGALSPL